MQVNFSIMFDPQLLQSSSFFFILLFQKFEVLLTFPHLLQQCTISLLLGHELSDHFSDVGVARARLDLAESHLDVVVFFHFFIHSFGQELRPHFLHHKLLSFLFLILVVRLVGSFFSDFLLPFDSCLPF